LIWSVPLRQRDPVHFPLRTCPYNLLLTEGEKSVSRIWNHLKICFLGLKKKTGKIVSNPGSVLVGFLCSDWSQSQAEQEGKVSDSKPHGIAQTSLLFTTLMRCQWPLATFVLFCFVWISKTVWAGTSKEENQSC
jgi:hypothetical protein